MGEPRVRARELGITIGIYSPGKYNAITDVPGVAVGHTTVHWGDATLPPGRGPTRTGVTVIWPHREDLLRNPVAAGFFALSGTGEMTGRSEIEELGRINTPLALTNTMSVGLVYDAVCRYLVERDSGVGADEGPVIPLVAECDDSFLNDARGFHVTHEHVYAALDGASTGPVAEGCVGAGTGMHCFQFKGGIGTSSRVLPAEAGGWTVGVLVLTNFGRRHRLTVAGVPVGAHLPYAPENVGLPPRDEGSGIVVVATDAPLDGRQLARVAKRAALGLGRTGSTGGDTSGELLVAFSTTYQPGREPGVSAREVVESYAIDPIFEAAVDATEEAVLNALCMATTTDGRDGHVLPAIPLDRLREILAAHGR
ncbi:P1 family peptidase [Sphaerobacter thermophilus]|uniref:Peptidase S58 DmpA n=1 Tax=Sphaerobacter thermophilus (strain ATCC 49802 / DSM 20745 / KCCM 41009 / NCIMB 13125 / S 6022) TaxID=479434 RepID=D1C3H6_SPHTD|nr:P1 family peptidase [Sphaerobacter thermophilus]ACZ38793.1 peptidase S58 DmpA [Sphaerobacter thermophilus DSM 20745]